MKTLKVVKEQDHSQITVVDIVDHRLIEMEITIVRLLGIASFDIRSQLEAVVARTRLDVLTILGEIEDVQKPTQS